MKIGIWSARKWWLVSSFGLAGFSLAMSALLCAPASHASGFSVTGKVTVYTREGSPREDDSNVVVFLDEVKSASAASTQPHPEIHQHGRKFLPEVLPVLVGTTVDFPNDDDVYHNVFSLSKPKPFDLGMYMQETVRSITFDQTGLVKIYCNIHPHMVSYVLVLNNPYFSVTNANGIFSISDVPEGEYLLRAWQRFGPEQSVRIRVGGSEPAPVSLALTEEQVSIKHNDKWGKPYKIVY